ncbi:CMRF35-like molecule 9 isoform X2 [Scleropages formosus]|uniref:CMRF35-like molecule 9 isoform X2 n=1 Tax=Scleropages formosus TaxID=113540 RepID=UPI0010FACE5B|nr:CMRF35-like molecule 9 isoform X2 [Scleropages formosus]
MKILTVTFCLLPALCCSGKMEVTGHVGQDVTVQCSHTLARSNGKYFCKGHCSRDADVLIKSESQSNKKIGRFSLYDNGTGTFWVTITGLKKTDTGTYWCAVDRAIRDTFTEVSLTVLDAPHPGSTPTVTPTAPQSTAAPPETTRSSQVGGQTTEEQQRSSAKTTSLTTSTAATKSYELLSLGSGLVAIVMVLALAVCIFVKVQRTSRKSLGSAPSCHRVPSDPARPGEIPHTEYNNIEINNLNQQPGGAPAIYEDLPDTLNYSSVEFLRSQECPTYSSITRTRKVCETPGDATRSSNSVLYSTVNLPREQPDSALYSTVSLPREQPDSALYSTVNLPSN